MTEKCDVVRSDTWENGELNMSLARVHENQLPDLFLSKFWVFLTYRTTNILFKNLLLIPIPFKVIFMLIFQSSFTLKIMFALLYNTFHKVNSRKTFFMILKSFAKIFIKYLMFTETEMLSFPSFSSFFSELSCRKNKFLPLCIESRSFEWTSVTVIDKKKFYLTSNSNECKSVFCQDTKLILSLLSH